jgi:hypothetical protein
LVFKNKPKLSSAQSSLAGGARRGYSGRISKAGYVMREQGLGSLLALVCRKLIAPIVECGSVVFFMRGTDGALPTAGDIGQVKVRVASPKDLPALLEACDQTKSEALLRDRFERGDVCFAAVCGGGKIAHCRWLSTHRTYVPELARDVVLRPGEAYFYDGYTRRDMRRHSVDGAVRCYIFSWLRAHGFKKAYSYACADNFAGLKAARRWQTPVGRLFYLRPLGRATFIFGRRTAELPVLAPASPRAAAGEPAPESRRAQGGAGQRP